MAGYRLFAGERELATRQFPLPADVAPGDEIELEIPVTWPEAAGEYRLVLDLALHPVGWFEENLGEPMVSALVQIEGR